jgi:hypothetical protein
VRAAPTFMGRHPQTFTGSEVGRRNHGPPTEAALLFVPAVFQKLDVAISLVGSRFQLNAKLVRTVFSILLSAAKAN